jgi:cytochrome oxidase Cu insertion factor (SCO1/SenC/PrrC family)
MILLLITFTGIMVYWFAFAPKPPNPNELVDLDPQDNPYASLFLPSFTLLDREGEAFDQTYLDGKYTVVDFFYTSCPLICPGMSAAMRDIQNATTDTDLQLLSISIDPEVDRPSVLKTYAGGFQADPARWKFGTGTPDMTAILLMGMNFHLGELNTDDGFRNIDHPSSLLLIGPDRHVIGLYRYSDPDEIDALIEKARELAG